MKVLMTSDCVGGVWTYTLDLVHELAALGHEVVVAVMGRPLTTQQQHDLAATPAAATHTRAYRLEWMPQPDNDLTAAATWLLELAERHRPDVVHLNQLSFGALRWPCPALLVAHSDVVTWWRAVHGQDPPPAWDAYRERVGAGLEGADLVVAPTDAMLRDLRDAYAFASPTAVVHNGRRFVQDETAAEPLIVAVGRAWDEAKNIAAVVRAADGLPWPLQVAGESAMGGPPYLGLRSSAEVAELLARASIFAAPARYEPFGLAAVEAALAGCALVLGDIPTLREVWSDAAAYVGPDDEPGLRAVLRDLIDDPVELCRRQDAARSRARTFDAASTAAAYVTHYRDLSRHRSPAGVSR